MATEKVRIALFGSFYRGFYMLNELLFGEISKSVEVVGVATDDPRNSFVSPQKRVWQYPHSEYERNMVEILATRHGLPVYKQRVNESPFHEMIENEWKPELCVMSTFGQRIRKRLIHYPALGFYNLHPCLDDSWPSKYVGGNPFDAMKRDQMPYIRVAFHAIDENFDTGPLIAMGEKIAIPDETTVVDMHKITSVSAARLAADELLKIIERGTRRSAPRDE